MQLVCSFDSLRSAGADPHADTSDTIFQNTLRHVWRVRAMVGLMLAIANCFRNFYRGFISWVDKVLYATVYN